ncbi:hypothetical protein Tco_1126223, partial [Tanacetum coccineum]
MALSPSSFHNRYISSYETQSSSSSSSLTLPSRKRYRGTSKLIADIETQRVRRLHLRTSSRQGGVGTLRGVEEVGDLSLESMEDEEVSLVDGIFEGA